MLLSYVQKYLQLTYSFNTYGPVAARSINLRTGHCHLCFSTKDNALIR